STTGSTTTGAPATGSTTAAGSTTTGNTTSSSSPTTSGALVFQSSTPLDATLKVVNQNGVQTFVLVDRNGNVLASQAVANTTRIEIGGSSANDALAIDQAVSHQSTIPVVFRGGA